MNSISGGSRWHWRAWRQARTWRSVSLAIDRYHRDFGPSKGELLLLGCSAGWMLQTAWLQGFSKIIAVDFDPLAPLLFRMRHRGLADLRWQKGDALHRLEVLLNEHPRAAVFFDNMLGQQALISIQEKNGSDAVLGAVEERLARLKQQLRGRVWGSLHDRLSGPVRITASDFQNYASQPMVRLCGKVRYEKQLIAWLSEIDGLHAHGEWLDHLTGVVFPDDIARSYFLWPFENDYWHWLELAWVSPEKVG